MRSCLKIEILSVHVFKIIYSGLDKDLDQWVFDPNEYFTPYLKYQTAENAKPCKKA